MKQQLRHIYDDLSNGKLSQQEALERIKAIKLQEQSGEIGALLAIPGWQAASFEMFPAGANNSCAEHHVMLSGLKDIPVGKLAFLLSDSYCISSMQENTKILQNVTASLFWNALKGSAASCVASLLAMCLYRLL